MSAERLVLLTFSEEYRSEAAITEVIDRTPEMLSGVEQIRGLRFGRPSDDASAASWDLLLVVEFESPDDIEPYRVHPEHRAYYEQYLEPRLEVIKAWNFEF